MFYIVQTPVGLMATLLKPEPATLPIVQKTVRVNLSFFSTSLNQDILEGLFDLPETIDWERSFGLALSRKDLDDLSKMFLDWSSPLDDELVQRLFLNSLREQSEVFCKAKEEERKQEQERPYPSEADVVDAMSFEALLEESDEDDVVAEIQYQLDRHAGPFLDPDYAKELEDYGFVIRKTKAEELDYFFSNTGYHMAIELIVQKGIHTASLDDFDCANYGNLSGYEPDEIIASWKRLGIIN